MITHTTETELFSTANRLLDSAMCDDLPTTEGRISRTLGRHGLGSVLLHFRDGSVADLSQDPVTDSMPMLDIEELETAKQNGRVLVKGTLYTPSTNSGETEERIFPADEQDVERATRLFTAAHHAIEYM